MFGTSVFIEGHNPEQISLFAGAVNFKNILKPMKEMRRPMVQVVLEFKAVSKVNMLPYTNVLVLVKIQVPL